MENTDIDMVIIIPDTPDRPVRHSSISREVKRRTHSPEAPVRHHREEYRNHLNGRTRTVPEVGEIRDHSGTQTENGDRSRASRANSLFRRPAVEKDKGKSISTDPSAARVDRHPVLNLNQCHGQAHVTTSRCLPSEGIRELHSSNNSCSPLRGDHYSFMLPGNSNKGKEKVESGSVSNRETIDLSSDKKQNRGTKRLVRHGCISPHGIAARARQAADTNSKGTISVEQELAPTTASSISIKEIVSENDIHGRARGKRPEVSRSRVANREGSEGWVSTLNRKLNMDHEMYQREDSDANGICSSVSRLDVHETGAVERVSRQQRRRKNKLTTSRASNEPEVNVMGSSGEPSSSRPPRIQNHQRYSTQVLEIEDSSPEERVFQGPRRIENNVSDVNISQIEADEILARELQEQLYQESTMIRDEQIDENIARLLEQEENSFRASSSHATTRNTRSSNTNAANPGGRSRLEARLQQLSSRRRLNPPQARVSLRVPSLGRGYRLGRAPAPSSASLHRAMNLSFRNDMGLESRLNFLEGLENAFGHSITNNNLLHMDRDFTEDDYELLLALDENNHRHGGAATDRINNLPESTVQSESFEETCVICLETPTIGDTIRHLPCLHKFHKDCIDPWLGRSQSCPVCKFSVT